MTLEQRLKVLALAMGTDVKTLIGTIGLLTNLNTIEKSSIVNAINEVVYNTNKFSTDTNNRIGNMDILGTLSIFNAPDTIDVQPSASLIYGLSEGLYHLTSQHADGLVKFYGYELQPYTGESLIIKHDGNTSAGANNITYYVNTDSVTYSSSLDVIYHCHQIPQLDLASNLGNYFTLTQGYTPFTAYSDLVTAINDALTSTGIIDDTKGNGELNKTWSADKIFDEMLVLKNSIIEQLTGTAPELLNQFSEFAAALGNNPNFATDIMTMFATRLRFDEVMLLTNAQKQNVLDSIGAAKQSDLQTLNQTVATTAQALQVLTDAVGNTDQDLVAIYNTAKS